VNTSAPDHDSTVFLLQPFASPTIEDMNLSRSGGTNFIVVSPFVTGFQSGKATL
jgi:hypothetical protein